MRFDLYLDSCQNLSNDSPAATPPPPRPVDRPPGYRPAVLEVFSPHTRRWTQIQSGFPSQTSRRTHCASAAPRHTTQNTGSTRSPPIWTKKNISNEWGIQDIIQKLGKDSLLHHNEVRMECKFGVHWGGPARFTYNSLKIAILHVVDDWYLSIISILYLLLFINTISFVYFQF